MIGITLGDPNGVGPEILLKSIVKNKISGPVVAIGDYTVLNQASVVLGYNVPVRKIGSIEDHREGFLNVLDLNILKADELTPGQVSKKGGRASLEYITKATRLALDGKIEGIVTLPVNKEAIRLVDSNFSGHTGHIAALCAVSDYTMMLVSDKLIVTHVSTHVSLREAIEMVKKDRILTVIRLTYRTVQKLRKSARIAVAALNPHAGEGGAFGDEEIREIAPAVKMAREEGLDVAGPLPPDTLFYQAVDGRYDAVVCMYHDQGHIPLKLLEFDRAINVTLGLPVIRTSVDHGTAYDIAYQGKASITSFVNAYNLALEMKKSI